MRRRPKIPSSVIWHSDGIIDPQMQTYADQWFPYVLSSRPIYGSPYEIEYKRHSNVIIAVVGGRRLIFFVQKIAFYGFLQCNRRNSRASYTSPTPLKSPCFQL